MSNEYKRILPLRKLTGPAAQPESEAWDAGGYRLLELQFRFPKSGSANGFLALEHSATNEPGSFVLIPGTSVELSTTGGVVSVSNFLRFVRWVTTGTVSGDPLVQIDAVAKN